jgi:hypothetical protein
LYERFSVNFVYANMIPIATCAQITLVTHHMHCLERTHHPIHILRLIHQHPSLPKPFLPAIGTRPIAWTAAHPCRCMLTYHVQRYAFILNESV